MRVVNTSVRKKDAMQLVTGQPVYVDDLAPQDCLIVKLLRSPYANAMVKTINTAIAMKVPGIEAIYTWEDVPQDAKRYTQAGQTYPEASPYDRLLIDRHVRFQGDIVAIVAGKDEKCVDKALRLIKVQYEVLEPVLDFHTSKDNPILVHPEDNWESLAPVGADNKRNLCAHDECGNGDVEAVLKDCDIVIDHVYPAAVKRTDAGTGLTETCIVSSNRKIAHHVKNMTAADTPSGNHCNDGFRAGSDLTLEIQNVQTRNAVAADIAAVAANLLVSSGAEGIFSLTGKNDDTDVFVVTSVCQSRFHFSNGQGTECIAHLRTINRNFGNPFF